VIVHDFVPARVYASAFAAVALLAAGCGERTEPLGPLPEQYPVQVRGAGGALVTVKREPQRIVALDPGSAQLVDRLGAGRRLVGAPAQLALRGRPARVASPSGAVDVQAVLALHPDLIVATTDTDPVDLNRAAQGSGAAVYVQPSSSVHDVERATSDLGFLIGTPVAARQAVARMENGVARIQRRIAGTPVVRVFVDTGFFVPAPADSLLGDLVRRARGQSVAGPNPGQEPYTPTRIARLDPQLYLLTSDSGVDPKHLRRESPTRRIPAVKQGHIEVLPSALVQRAGPNVVAGLAAVARALHPDAFH
jgi:ABC-type Fe3+-hydroxamate transport system substrate-binding protein